MAGTIPQYSRKQVNAAGEALIGILVPESKSDDALTIINNWRSSHSLPLNIFRRTLKRNAGKVDQGCLVAQRIKRLSSISLKLSLFPHMRLSQMQDIGGCRAIVKDVRQVKILAANYHKFKGQHKLDHIDDYIESPRRSGYRGIHLIYRYNSDKNPAHNGLKIEIQLRSLQQHAWATAVETVGTFIRQALKSSQGEDIWLRFFALMGTQMALQEGTPPVPNTPINKDELIHELRSLNDKLDVASKLDAYGAALQTFEQPSTANAKYFLLELDPVAQELRVSGFREKELDRASSAYLAIEQEIKDKPGAEAVLVSVDSLMSLRRAYPNYFLDTSIFVSAVNNAIKDKL